MSSDQRGQLDEILGERSFWDELKENRLQVFGLTCILGALVVGLWAVGRGKDELQMKMQKARIGFQVMTLGFIGYGAFAKTKSDFIKQASQRP